MMSTSISLALGDPALDHEHAELMRDVLEFAGAPQDEVRAALERVRERARHHFALEDDDLRRLGGHSAACHLDEHAAVLKSLDEVLAVLADPATQADVARDITGRLASALFDWLPEHVRQMDAAVAAARTKKRLGGAAIVFAPKPST